MTPTFYIVIGCVVFIGMAVGVIVGSKVSERARSILSKMRCDDAIVQSVCMIRVGAIQSPGVALIADNLLIIHVVVSDKRIEIPLTKVTVSKEGSGFGKCGWWGKRVFYLDTPEIRNLAIGLKDPEPWRKAFAEKIDS